MALTGSAWASLTSLELGITTPAQPVCSAMELLDGLLEGAAVLGDSSTLSRRGPLAGLAE